MSYLLLVTLFVSASAFVPSRMMMMQMKKNRVNTLQMNNQIQEVGVLPPTGFWDPLGLAKNADEATYKNYREAELKHGRVAMLAVFGYIFQEFFRLPGGLGYNGELLFNDIPNGVGAIGAVPSFGWLQIVASIGYWELIGWEDKRVGDEPGNFNFGTKFFGSELSGDRKVEYQTKELQNGRLAMLAIIELITHDIARPAGEGLFVLHHY
eukprot:CAMPEP_0173154812 /NCGR_PEP_ID=MMETSP1105-20130129/13711_1 /TAXON_ID=2985 /ORGANISM="Ochromonas sp., Strain BG-1" /LENGTH=208 /DNA_ID=CAMNT_0014071075 /DNA_START=9 /DNA_END=635 /DNA_ORIENTATION=+